MLIDCGDDGVMSELAWDVLGRKATDKRFYGCGEMNHDNLIELLRAPVTAIVGLCVTDAAVTMAVETRQRLAPFYKGVPVYVDDPLSIEWLKHYDVHDAKLGTNPAWAAGQARIDEVVAGWHDNWRQESAPDGSRVWTVSTVGMAIAGALAGRWLYLEPRGEGQEAFVDGVPYGHHPLVRFAARYGLPVNEPCRMETDAVVKARKEANRLVQRLLGHGAPEETVDDRVDKALGFAPPPKPNVRRLEPGTVFDPATHYTAEYYDGRGIEYQLPDGSWAMYHGTALHWGGFTWVAKTLGRLLGNGSKRILDVGCSAGAFVSEMRDRGFDAYGIDLSAEAHQYARPEHKQHLLVGDVCQPLEQFDGFDVVTSWDLLEHIYTGDIDALLTGIFGQLRLGGLFINTICTRGEGENDFVAHPGTVVTAENSTTLVSGHVNIRSWGWWAELLQRHGFVLRYDLMYLFQMFRASDPVFRDTRSWSPRNTLFAQRPTAEQERREGERRGS